jgi:hypothetical protein
MPAAGVTLATRSPNGGSGSCSRGCDAPWFIFKQPSLRSSTFAVMDEQDRVLRLLDDAGALGGIRWAHHSAYRQVWQDFTPEGGHDQGWIGYTAYKYLVNRQDKVFQCGQFAAPPGEDTVGRDVIAAGMADRDFQSMPDVAPRTVVRRDLNLSPGWTAGGWRWLTASYKFGQVDKIRWPEKSETKGQVARQPHGVDDGGLFPLTSLPGLPPLGSLSDPERELRRTLVLAHAMDPDTGESQLYLGRARWNTDRRDAWVWKESLLTSPSSTGSRGGRPHPLDPMVPPSGDVADADVRVRRPASGDTVPRAIGEA